MDRRGDSGLDTADYLFAVYAVAIVLLAILTVG